MPPSAAATAELKRAEAKLLSGDEVVELAGPSAKTLLYPQLADYSSLEELFQTYANPVVILYMHSADPHPVGHWALLSSPDDGDHTIEFFDSYSMGPDDALKQYSEEWKEESGQDEQFILQLMHEWMQRHESAGGTVWMNEYKDQKHSPSVATCGRHVGLRGRYFRVPMQRYQDELHRACREAGVTPDALVTRLTERLLAGEA